MSSAGKLSSSTCLVAITSAAELLPARVSHTRGLFPTDLKQPPKDTATLPGDAQRPRTRRALRYPVPRQSGTLPAARRTSRSAGRRTAEPRPFHSAMRHSGSSWSPQHSARRFPRTHPCPKPPLAVLPEHETAFDVRSFSTSIANFGRSRNHLTRPHDRLLFPVSY